VREISVEPFSEEARAGSGRWELNRFGSQYDRDGKREEAGSVSGGLHSELARLMSW
jgi:hypothetical protein